MTNQHTEKHDRKPWYCYWAGTTHCDMGIHVQQKTVLRHIENMAILSIWACSALRLQKTAERSRKGPENTIDEVLWAPYFS